VVIRPEIQELAGWEVVQKRVLGQPSSCFQHPLGRQGHGDHFFVSGPRAVLVNCAGVLRSAGCPAGFGSGGRYQEHGSYGCFHMSREIPGLVARHG
jgi:hypothetical protein